MLNDLITLGILVQLTNHKDTEMTRNDQRQVAENWSSVSNEFVHVSKLIDKIFHCHDMQRTKTLPFVGWEKIQ